MLQIHSIKFSSDTVAGRTGASKKIKKKMVYPTHCYSDTSDFSKMSETTKKMTQN